MTCLEQDNCKNMTTRREIIWGRYNDIRMSDTLGLYGVVSFKHWLVAINI